MTQETLVAVQKKPAFAAGELTERIIAEKQGSIGWLTFNNPARRNAISIDMWEAIPKVLDRFERDSEVRVIVLKGEGDKAFVSGADVSQYEKDRSTAEGIQRYEEIAGRVAERLQTCDKVIIAMIRGYCLGAGVNIALCSDLRIAAEDARLGIPAAKLGLGYRASSLKNLVDIVGPAFAPEVLITGRQFKAEEAKTMGPGHRAAGPTPWLASCRGSSASTSARASSSRTAPVQAGRSPPTWSQKRPRTATRSCSPPSRRSRWRRTSTRNYPTTRCATSPRSR